MRRTEPFRDMKPSVPVLSAAAALALLVPGLAAADPATAADKLTPDTFLGLELRNLCPAVAPARIADIAVDPRHRSVWYVVSASSGLWKTWNHGGSWTPIFDNYGSYSLGCVSLDPRDPDVVWLGAGENQALRSVSYGDGIYKSTDGGETWKHLGLTKSEHIAKILIDPRNSDVVYVACQGPLWAPGGDRGLYKTTDGGQTWQPVLQISENTGVTDIAFDPRDPDVIYAAAYQRRRNVGLLIGGGPEAGLFKTTNVGVNWTKLTNGIPDVDLGRIALAVSPQQPDVIYAAITAASRQSGFFRSTNAGDTWTRQRNYQMVDPQYYGKLFPNPFKFDSLYIIDSVIQSTTDGGKTIRAVPWQVHVDNHALDFDPNDPDHLLVGNDGGLYETWDGGRSWRHFDNLPIDQFYGLAVDNALPFYNIYGGSQDNGSMGGPSRTFYRAGIRNSDWKTVGGGDGMQPRVDPKDPNIVYVQSQNADISRLDLATSLSVNIHPRAESNQPVRWNWDAPLIISPHDHARIYLAGNRLFRSDDRGAHWKTVSPDLTRQINRDTLPVMGRVWGSNAVTKNLFTTDLSVSTALCESSCKAGLLYVGTDDGLIQVSDDAGASWRKVDAFPGVPDQTPVSCLFASQHDAGTVYAAFNNYQRGDFKPYLLKSANRGRDWTSIAANLPGNHPVWSIVEDPVNQDLLFVGTEFGLFFTLDGGNRWIQLRAGVPTAAFRDLEIQTRETDLVCATFGRGFFILDDFSPLRFLNPGMLASNAVLFPPRRTRVYHEETLTRASYGNFTMPNPPFGAAFTYYLRDDLSGDSPTVVLAVADAKGKTIRQVTGPATPGVHRVTWNLRADAAPATGRERDREEADEAEPEDDASEAAREAEEAGVEPQSADTQELQRMGSGGAPGAGRGGGRRGGGRGNTGVLVSPGKYQVTLGQLVNGKLTPLAKPQVFEVAPLEPPSWTGPDHVGVR